MRLLPTLLLVVAWTAACDPPTRGTPSEQEPDGPPPTARTDVVESFRAARARPRHASDGGGRAWLELAEGADGAVQRGTPGRWSFLFEVGPEGIAEDGSLWFQVPPFWGWSDPQARRREQLGYTEVESLAEGVLLEARAFPPTLLQVVVRGRALVEGERVRLVYGAGPAGALADRHAERGSPFWFHVDGDGDGARALIAEAPRVDVLPGPPARLVLHVSATARPGGSARLTVAVVDALASSGCEVAGSVRLSSEPPLADLPPAVELRGAERGLASVEVPVGAAGTYRIRGELALVDESLPEGAGATLAATSNPLWVSAEGAPVYWADLHGHSNVSDGTGLPEEYFAYARDVAGLDAVALTDHDHWGLRFLDEHPETWAAIQDQVSSFHEPGRFVTLPAYEWTSWSYGHRHVLYFAEGGEVLSWMDPETETPQGLWAALRGRPALTFAHHSAGGPIATDWSIAPDPVLEPLTEIVSAHGSSEAADSPARIYAAVPGNFVRDALERGYHLGFVGGGDGHDGHPGLTHLSPIYGYRQRSPRARGDDPAPPPRLGNGGLAAVRAEELTRPALLAAMRARRTWATSGPRILLEASLNGHPAGSTIPADALRGDALLALKVSGTAPLEQIDVIRSGELAERVLCAGRLDVESVSALKGVSAGEYVYLRVEQSDGGLAWSSPFFVEEPGTRSPPAPNSPKQPGGPQRR